jgi:putative acetyltransferase
MNAGIILIYKDNNKRIRMSNYPEAKDPEKVGSYPATACAGGGYVWDAVLEYRVWCHPERGAPDEEDGNDYYYVFTTYEEAYKFSTENTGCEEPIALILQKEYIDEPEPGKYIHMKKQRIAEWHVEFLNRPKRTKKTIPDFLSADAPANRLDIIRGIAGAEEIRYTSQCVKNSFLKNTRSGVQVKRNKC